MSTATTYITDLAASGRYHFSTADIAPLLAAGTPWNAERAFEVVLRELVAHLPGAPWRGGRAGH